MEGPEMNDQFYAFWSSAWNVFNSNFWAALAGAFAGAVAASKFAARQERRDDLVRTVKPTPRSRSPIAPAKRIWRTRPG
jgi:hypothetical protein